MTATKRHWKVVTTRCRVVNVTVERKTDEHDLRTIVTVEGCKLGPFRCHEGYTDRQAVGMAVVGVAGGHLPIYKIVSPRARVSDE